MPFNDAVKKVTEDLKQAGFAILTDIDTRGTWKILGNEWLSPRPIGLLSGMTSGPEWYDGQQLRHRMMRNV